MNKDVKQLLEKAEAAGWTTKRTGGGHYCLRPPSPRTGQVFIPSTPSDGRSLRNARAMLKRWGLVL